MKIKILTKTVLIAAITLLPLLMPSPVHAADATVEMSPATASHTPGEQFTADLVIDAKGESFNAAEATVTISGTQINNLVLGDCNFSFIKTPTTTDPSFTGVILGGSSKKCTIYTLNLTQSPQPITITINNATLKSYPDAKDFSLALRDGIYSASDNAASAFINTIGSLTDNQPTPKTQNSSQPTTPPQNTPTEVADLSSYTVALQVLSQNGDPLTQATAVLSAPIPSGQTDNKTATTGDDGSIKFEGVPAGIYKVEIMKENKPVAQTIINVSGRSPVLTLGMQEKKQSNEWTMIVLIGIMLALVLFFAIRFSFVKKIISQTNRPIK